MRTIQTHLLEQRNLPLDSNEQLWVYNGLDAAVTSEVWAAIKPQLDASPAARRVYNFAFSMQACALKMSLRGLDVDQAERSRIINDLTTKVERLQFLLDTLATEIWGRPLNPNSPKQLAEFFYGVMQLPEQKKYDKKTRTMKVHTDRNALEKLSEYFNAKPIIAIILAAKALGDVISVLKSGIDPDGRMRCSYNVTGTETGRWSSSRNVYYRGTNLNNINDRVRRVFVAAPRRKLGQVDLAQAESVVVAYLSGDPAYISACFCGDLHTFVARMVWPELPWTGDIKKDKAIAKRPFYRHFSYRDMSKRGGHASNYMGTPFIISQHLKIEQRVAQEFQERYFDRFPGIPSWHRKTIFTLQSERTLTTPLGRTRLFFGRPDDKATWKEAIAHVPQSVIGDVLNVGLWRAEKAGVDILAQVYDSILFEFPEGEDDYWVPLVQRCVHVPVPVNGNLMIIGSDAKVGWNWSEDKEEVGDNPYGLIDYKPGGDSRRRPVAPTFDAAIQPLLDRQLRLGNQFCK